MMVFPMLQRLRFRPLCSVLPNLRKSYFRRYQQLTRVDATHPLSTNEQRGDTTIAHSFVLVVERAVSSSIALL